MLIDLLTKEVKENFDIKRIDLQIEFDDAHCSYPNMCDGVKYNKICEKIYKNKWIMRFHTIAGVAIAAIPTLVYIGFTLLAFLCNK